MYLVWVSVLYVSLSQYDLVVGGLAVVADVTSTHNYLIAHGHMEADMGNSVLLPQ